MSGRSFPRVLPTGRQIQVVLLAGAIVVLPALLASTVLWQVLSQQIDSSYEKRLSANLETFGLIMENRHRNLSDALTRIAAERPAGELTSSTGRKSPGPLSAERPREPR